MSSVLIGTIEGILLKLYLFGLAVEYAIIWQIISTVVSMHYFSISIIGAHRWHRVAFMILISCCVYKSKERIYQIFKAPQCSKTVRYIQYREISACEFKLLIPI